MKCVFTIIVALAAVSLACESEALKRERTTRCGNGTLDAGETCDPGLGASTSCTSLDPLAYSGGIATCSASCTLDLSPCVPQTLLNEFDACGGMTGCPCDTRSGTCDPDFGGMMNCFCDPDCGATGPAICNPTLDLSCRTFTRNLPTTGMDVNVSNCLRDCDPMAADPCGAGFGCYEITPTDGVCLTLIDTDAACASTSALEMCDEDGQCLASGFVGTTDPTVCRKACDPMGMDPCPGSQICDSVLNLCVPPAARHAECLRSTGLGCEDPLFCEVTEQDQMGAPTRTECKLRCDGDDLNSQGTCPMGEFCLPAAVAVFGGATPSEFQLNGGNPIACTTVGGIDNCDGANNYECGLFVSGMSLVRFCARPRGWCGTIVTPAPYAETEAFVANTSMLPSVQHRCSTRGETVLCGVTNPSGSPAKARCLVDPTSAQGVCYAVCHDASGGPDYDCGTGHTCTPATTTEGFFWEPEFSGNMPVTCSMPMDPVCDEPTFTCQDVMQPGGGTSGFTCFRPESWCMP